VRRALGRPFRFIELANDVNDHMPDYVVRRLTMGLNKERKAVNGSNILLLGLAYKKNSGDAREAPAMAVASRLLDLGALVSAADPHVVEDHVDRRVVRVEATAKRLAAADAVVVLTDHDAFDREVVAANARYVLDTRHFVDGPHVEHL